MVSKRQRNRLLLASAAIGGICVPAVVNLNSIKIAVRGAINSASDSSVSIGDGDAGSRRALRSISQFRNSVGSPTEFLPSWARLGLRTNTETPNFETETAVFWHIPQSGGATVKHVYECMGRSIANRVGVLDRFGHGEENELIEFEPFKEKDWKTVNVDVTSKEGILRAAEMGLAASQLADLVVTTEPSFAGQHLFDGQNKARYMGMFRHPVERLISKFYFLRTADWIPTYRPELKTTSLVAWAGTRIGNADENFLVRKLNSKTFGDPVDETDLETAKQILEHTFIVGLSSNIEESVRRFNVVMALDENGIDPELDERAHGCMDDLSVKVESFKDHESDHPKIEEDGRAWQILAERNSLDMKLYEFIQELFDEQKPVIEEFKVRGRLTQVRRYSRKAHRAQIRARANSGAE